MILIAFGGQVMAVEEAQYEIIKTYDKFELRKYKTQVVAETVVEGDFGEVGNKAFRILFDYLNGNNIASQKIAMTAPVTQNEVKDASQKIAMTAPVTQSVAKMDSTNETYTISFVMPADFTLETTPIPVDSLVNIREIPEKTFAAIRYSGSWNQDKYLKHEAILLTAVKKSGLKTIGDPVFARYNSPFALWFMRRNEVLIEIDM